MPKLHNCQHPEPSTGFDWLKLLLSCLVFATPFVANAQFLQYGTIARPAGVQYLVLQGAHFDIVFEQGYDKEARAALRVLQTHLDTTRTLLQHRHKLHMPVVLNGFNDQSNGYVTPMPFRQEIEIAFLKGTNLSPVHPSWFDTVMPHELVHAVHADLRKGFGVSGILHPFFPDLSRTFNLLIPPGISEGLAVYHESRHQSGAGRLNHSLFRMRFRAAMMSDKPWSMAQLVETPAYTRPGDRFYLGGAHLVDYLAEDEGLRFFHRSSALNYRVPLLGYGVGLWYGKKMWPAQIYRNFRESVIEKERDAQRTRGPFTNPRVLASEKGLVHRRPLWVDDQQLVVYASGYNLRSGFYIVDVESGRRQLLRITQPAGDHMFSLSADRRRLFYAHYSTDPLVAIKRIADIFEIELDTGGQRRITSGQRVLAPAEILGTMWGLQNAGQGNSPVLIEEDGSILQKASYADVRFQQIAASPAGNVAAVVNIKGRQGIFWMDAATGQLAPDPVVMFDNGSVYDVAWSTSGEYLLFTADPEGISNIFVLDVEQELVSRLTNAQYGALQPSLSPDGQTLAYIDYQHEQYNLVMLPFEADGIEGLPSRQFQVGPFQGSPFQQSELLDEDDLHEQITSEETVTDYKPLRYMRPRAVLPIVRPKVSPVFGEKKIGPGLGVLLQGADPLERVSYQVQGYGQADNFWGSASIQAGGRGLQPFASIYNTLSTIVTGLRDETGAIVEQVRVGRQRRGVFAGFQVPYVFERNVFQSGLTFRLQAGMEDERFYISDNQPFTRQYSIDPAFSAFYRVQSNTRDLIPNHGVALTLNSTYDLQNNAGSESRAMIGRLTGYLPFLRESNIGMQAYGALLMQNRRGVYNVDRFLPRGYKDEILLDRGNHAVFGFEYVQPVWYVDNGFFMIPIYIKAIYMFGFTEGLISDGFFADNEAIQTGNVVSSGAGVGVQFRVLYLFNFDLRFTAAFRYSDNHWDFDIR